METSSKGTIVVAGSDGALGGAAFKHFASQGFHVIGSVFSEEAATDLKTQSNSEGWRTEVHILDLGSFAACKAFSENITSAHSDIQLVFNAAGGFRYTSTVDCSQKDFDFLMSANFYSCWHLAKFFTPNMQKQKFGRLIFVSSRKTIESGQANFGVYTASKAALDAMVKSLADEIKGSGVTVNLIAPTVIDTPANREAMPGSDVSKWVTTGEIIKTVEFLLSEKSQSINGSTIILSGGL